MPRQARLDTPGTLHHVILRGIERRSIVTDEEDRRQFVERLGWLASELKTAIYAWALLPTHAHLLLRSGPHGLPPFMRRFLTGYALAYNRRHHRHGPLFQNRYKSIVCEAEGYFTELVRYIHLNPFRAKLVRTLEEVDTYPWSGHAGVMGKVAQAWQARVQRQLGVRQKGPGVAAVIERACQKAGISAQELRGGSRRGQLSQLRATLAHQLVADFGLPLAEVAQQLGVTSSAIYKALQKRDAEKFH